MAISAYIPTAEQPETQTPGLLEETLSTTVDYKGRPAKKSDSGRWRSASFLIAAEVAERFAYYGISSNLITYLTGPLGFTTASAAENVNAWSGTDMLLPFVGAFAADSFLGCYRTIVISSVIYVVGLGLLTLSATLPSPSACSSQNTSNIIIMKSCSPCQLQVILFLFSLYLIAVGLGGQKPCLEAFGADQFDGEDPEERKAKSSFFNWWFFGTCGGVLISLLTLVYIQDNWSWVLGFGISCISMILSLFLFLLGFPTYRYKIKRHDKQPFARIGRLFVAAIRNRKATTPVIAFEEEGCQNLPLTTSQQFRFLNKALLPRDDLNDPENLCSADDIEEAKAALRLIPIWITSLVFAITIAQRPTYFTMQGKTMDRMILPGFEVPAASLQAMTSITILVFIPIYDRIFVPIARKLTREPAGITMLQRIGTGIFLSAICMLVAAVVETERLEIAEINGVIDVPNATVPMSVWWLVPQYILLGAADVFTRVGLQEFFYDQISNELKSVGLALHLSVFGVGNFLSSILVFVVEKATGAGDQGGWLSDNLNQAHLNYFYCLLVGINVVGLGAFLFFAKSYVYNRTNAT
ncbi:hypothetical protein DITRI_Ditri03aG0128600 [Diplodiscus trichospermus]